ncbi:unnamed protein product [Paramecium sonneborni]|uniref:Uncharacterized protein n=1 Tax=Paramecium sonneborni TaxID=65129 RepID=A0A8S1LPV1_9CILI|nr:unnamed protein product [Paramecium sonneborni]
MNQQFSVEYLGIKSTRYNRLPNLNNNPYLKYTESINLVSLKNCAFQEPKRICLNLNCLPSPIRKMILTIITIILLSIMSKKIKIFPNPLCTTTIINLYFAKYNELQTKLLVSDFKKKVDAFLKKNNQNYKTHLISNKITSSLKELQSLHQIKNEELLNQSLCSNKYTVKTEKKSMKAMEIFILGNNKLVTKQVISSELIQHRLLKQMENFLKDDRFNYDLKMTTMIEQYSEIVNRINEKAFTIKIPEKYVIQMSDYNEYYQIKEDQTDNILQNKLEIIADQIIQEIQQSKRTTPKILSHKTSDIYEPIAQQTLTEIEKVIQTEPTIIHQQQEFILQETIPLQQIIPDRKISNKKSRQRKKNQQNKNEINQSQQSSISEIMDSSLKNSTIKDNDDTRRKKKEKSKIIDQAKIEEEEQDLIQKEIEKQKKYLLMKKLREFNQKFKPNILSRTQSENIINLQIQEPIISTKPNKKIIKTLSIGQKNDDINLKEINEIIRIKRKQLYEYSQELLRLEKEQQQTIENFIQNKNNGSQKPLNLIVNGKPISELKEAAEFWDSKKNSPRSYTKKRQNINNSNLPDQVLQGQQQEINDNEQKNKQIEGRDQKLQSNKNLEEHNPDNKFNYQQVIHEKILSFEEKLKQQIQDIFDILLASDSVYNVKIDDYKIGKPYKIQINHPNFIFQQEQDEIVFTHQVLWRREIQEVIPKLNSVNKLLSVQLDSEDEYIQENLQVITEEKGADDEDDDNEDSQI